MRLKLDENIALSAKARLAALGFDVDTALDEGLGGRSDADVWSASQSEGRFLVTQDLDFSDRRRFEPGQHAGILLVRLPDDEQWRIGDFLVGWRASAVGARVDALRGQVAPGRACGTPRA